MAAGRNRTNRDFNKNYRITFVTMLFSLSSQYLCLVQAQRHHHEQDPLQVSMDLHPVYLHIGREKRVDCSINRGAIHMLHSLVEFRHIHYLHYTDPYNGTTTLTSNAMLANDIDPNFYAINVNFNGESTKFTLIFKNPRLEDNGDLICRLTPGSDIAPPNLATMSATRYVNVFE